LWDTTNNRAALLTDIWNYDHAIDFKEELIFAEIPSTVTALEAHLPINTPVLFELAAYGALSDITVPLRDDKVLVQFYAHDAKIMSNYRPIIEGMNAIKDYWSEHAKALASFEKLQSRTDKVEQAGGFTLHYGSHIANWRSDEYSGVSTGKHLRIWRREPDGILKTYVLISAYDK
jgi:ketosteroid isomerase-like protein